MVGGVSPEPELTLSPEIRGEEREERRGITLDPERYRERLNSSLTKYPLKNHDSHPFIQLGVVRQSYLLFIPLLGGSSLILLLNTIMNFSFKCTYIYMNEDSYNFLCSFQA